MSTTTRRVTLELDGHKDLQRAFDRLTGPETVKATREAMRRSWKRVHALVVAKVPVHTGRLKRGIKLRALKPKRGAGGGRVFGVHVALPYREDLGITGTAYYPAAVEFGRKTKGGGRTGARPFLRPAFDEGKEQATMDFAKHLGDSIGRIWAKR